MIMHPSNLVTRTLYLVAILALVFSLVPAPVSAEPPQQGGGLVYFVRPGDTLFWISQRFGTTVPAIMSANGLASDYIQAGQRLFIPVGYYPYNPYGSSIFAPQPLPPITPQSNPAFTCSYAVRPGDTVYSIAYRYRVTVISLMQANNLYSPLIFVNQQVKVPCNNPTPDPFATYTVNAGDNLLRIAIKYSTSIYALQLVNGIANPHIIFAGQTLVIPYPGSYVWQNVPPAPTPPLTHVVISQFRTHGTSGANDQFIEIYNPTSSIMNVSGWLIKISSSAGSVDTRFTFPANTQLNMGQHYLITNNSAQGYSSSVAADQSFNTSIPDNGGIALTLPDGTLVDQVGLSNGSAFREGIVLAPMTTNEDRAYERKLGGANGNCVDANNNAADFIVTAPSAPRNLASAAIICAATPTSTRVVISQFRTRGPNQSNDEFIEIYNPTNTTTNVGGWLIKASNSNGFVDTRFTFPANTQLNPGQHYLITNNSAPGYSGSVGSDQQFSTSITDDGGIALTTSDGTVIDQVGMSNGSVFKEGTPLAPLTTNVDRAYERKLGGANGNCQDTNNNATDFIITQPSTPRDLASAAIVCATNATPVPGITPTNTPIGGNSISIQNNAFFPNSLTVNVGTIVTWINKDSGPHTVRSGLPGPGNATTPLQSGTLSSSQTYTFTFPGPGTYPYFDEVSGTQGTVTVNQP